ncbi:class I SAM-dependent methyltransferase [Undibacterium fentianense]|uniref:Class I SAM-dependent methyltransferase n=1 Tax=Undibacterium fentianense TaxID=2828728 RepID=A0A941E0T8_9BURK|nr:class I SAM-dependent methyltransferase [Undibacterium fentianense]MBR7798584.1 class I SAM-dependent methyltransferase [Undibacterium fentianense]
MIRDFYNNSVEQEWTRLDNRWLEFETSYFYIKNHLTPESNILDIGGGPGKYAFRLAAEGHKVFLGDLSENSIAFANDYQIKTGIQLAGTQQLDVCDLRTFEENTFDTVICFGPFYHIQDEAQRELALKELHRVTKPGGTILVAFITHYAPIYDFVKGKPEAILSKKEQMKYWYSTGTYNPTQNNKGFPTAFFARPQDVPSFFSNELFNPLYMFGCEGILNQSEQHLLAQPEQIRNAWFQLSLEFAKTAISINSSEHIVFVVKKR